MTRLSQRSAHSKQALAENFVAGWEILNFFGKKLYDTSTKIVAHAQRNSLKTLQTLKQKVPPNMMKNRNELTHASAVINSCLLCLSPPAALCCYCCCHRVRVCVCTDIFGEVQLLQLTLSLTCSFSDLPNDDDPLDGGGLPAKQSRQLQGPRAEEEEEEAAGAAPLVDPPTRSHCHYAPPSSRAGVAAVQHAWLQAVPPHPIGPAAATCQGGRCSAC